jgi:Zn-dependent M28 family amino/carboxypeptidase/ketosteroid isomerase-like protein
MILLLAIVFSTALSAQIALTPSEQEVWQDELRIVEFQQAGNTEGFMGMFRDDYVGWSDRRGPSPSGKEDARKNNIRVQADTMPGSFKITHTPLAVRVNDGVALTFYRETASRSDRGGKRVESSVRTIHTWKRTGDGWKIIGAMNVSDPVPGTAPPVAAAPASPLALSPAEQEVWQSELRFVQYMNAKDIEGVVGLLHENFLGWSRGNPKPGTKEAVRSDLSAMRDSPRSLPVVTREPLSVRIYEDTAVVFYREKDTRLDANGKREESSVRATHTWKRTAAGWKVLGGMSAAEPVASRTSLPQTTSTTPATTIDAERVTAHVKVLSGDDFEGRAPATVGEKKTVDYITSQFAALGIKPGGEPNGAGGRRWTQDVPLVQSAIEGRVTATIRSRDATQSLRQGEDIAVRSTFLPVNRVSITNAPLVFVGYGINAPERQWDDFKGIDLHGKVAVVLINDPDFEADLGGRFDGKGMTYYGRWTYKFEEGARRGAVGVLIVHETDGAAYGWATVKNSFTTTLFDIRRKRPADTHPLLEAWIQRGVAVDLFRTAGFDFASEKKKAQSADFKPFPLGNVMISVAYRAKHTNIVSKNVIGIVKGSTHPEETIIYTAHWDHLGIGQPDARGDRIYNGARDNALGVGGLLELARLYAPGSAPQRSVIFIAFTAEEFGLLGSEYYVHQPLYPLPLTAAVFNMDGGNTFGTTRDVTAAGDGKVTLQQDLGTAAAREGRRFSPELRPEAGLFFRSDHFSFAKAGVPAISFRSGLDLVDGGVAAGKAAMDDHIAKRYHQPADEWSPTWDLRGMVMDTDLLYSVGRELANSRLWPQWLEGSEFKAIRDKTEIIRKP